MAPTAHRLLAGLLATAMLTLTACAGQAPAQPTAAPAAVKPTDAPKVAAEPTKPAPPSPAAGASPAASPSPSPSPSPAAAAAAPAAAKPASGAPTKIGALVPLSTPGDAAAGQLLIRGAELAVDFINQRQGGAIWQAACNLPGPIELVRGDDSGTPEKGVAGFRKMAQEDKVAGVIGQYHSSVQLALGPVADQLKVPVFSSQASDTKISSNMNKFVFQTHAITADRAVAVGNFIKDNKATFKKVAVVAENTDYGTGNTEALKQNLQGVADVQVRDWIFDRTSTDISPLLLQVKGFDPDLIYNIGVGAPAYLMVKQSYDTGLMPKATMLISYDLPIRPEFWQNLGDQGNNMVYVVYYHPQQALTDAGKWMQAEYQKRFNEPALYSSFQAFGNAIILAQAVNQACSTDGDAVVKALESGKFMNWNANGVSFPPTQGVDWHRIQIPILLLQYTAPNQAFDKATILSPAAMKTGEVKR
jgi:branched-chain amino acid transport system substrate-binding protein